MVRGQEEVFLRWVLSTVVVLGLFRGSRGLDLALSRLSSGPPPSPADLTKSQPAFAPASPVTIPEVLVPPPASSAHPPRADEGASSPADPSKLQTVSAPSPLPLPKGSVAPPPVAFSPFAPATKAPSPVATPSVAFSPPAPAINAPSPVTTPPIAFSPPAPAIKAASPVATPAVVAVLPVSPPPPTRPALLPSVQAPPPANSGNVEPKWPVVPPPSVNTKPSSPIGPGPSVPHHSPPPLPPERSDVHPDPPKSSSSVIPPPASAQAPREHPAKPPVIPPTIAHTPQPKTPAPSNVGNNGNTMSPPRASPSAGHKNNHHIPLAPPPKETTHQITPAHNSPTIRSSPAISPVPHNSKTPSDPTKTPSNSHAQPPSLGVAPRPAPATAVPAHGRTARKGAGSPAFAPSHPPLLIQGPEVSRTPEHSRTKRRKRHAPLPSFQGHSDPPIKSPSSSMPSLAPPTADEGPNVSPTVAPSPSIPTKTKAPATPHHPVWTLPPPPPNLDCNSLTCPEPLTDPPLGAPCVCVLPIKVGLRLNVALYAFFPLVSDFAQQVASGVNMVQKQVRVMGANVASDQSDKTVVLMDLVPLQVKFDNDTAFSTFESFWNKKVSLKSLLTGDYDVLYVVYPGLPPSPPSAPANVDVGDGAFGNNRNSRTMKPLGVDVGRPKRKANGNVIAIAVLSTFIALTICALAAWLLILRWRNSTDVPERFPHGILPKISRSSGTGHVMLGGRFSSPSGSLSSSIATYTGQAKTFKLAEIERATDGFDDSKVLGEGGFGCVYHGMLEDRTRVAVKVLKRYDYQGEREFLAEVEMLGRLHHRNLVKLLGICVEENARCLVYELIPNGSVESHLHGLDRESAPLDWNARMKIALGAARGLAYLHEDSSPCVIHRDFKSSNILLEYDFTPKVSDFGLARTAKGEGNQHISTRVMGTFGYVAPEYAMTGHLLVKSDVYSYGVVLLELLTGRKPVDMSRPPGQENLVTWARPLLANVVSLREAVDPLLGNNVPYDNMAKVAAIASMCVQPEVAHRPSMSEVVQALKLVCNEGDECSQELVARAAKVYGGAGLEAERVLLSDMFCSSPIFTPCDSGSFHKQSSSGPLTTGKGRKFWQRLRSLSRGSMSEHGTSLGFDMCSEGSDR